MAEAPHEEFRRKDLVASLSARIAKEASAIADAAAPGAQPGAGQLRIMHVCGTHERSLNRFGIRSFLPPSVKVIAGPGCPVCICPVSDIVAARAIAKLPGVILATFGDMLNVPTPEGSLLDARSEGGEVRIVYSAADALELARSMPDRQVVFFSVGFETTVAPTAAVVASLEARPQANFSLIASNRVVPEALEILLSGLGLSIDGFILPGHVSVIIGTDAYLSIVDDHKLPCAVAGFEPVDMLSAILDILVQIRTGEPRIANSYSRAVLPGGNPKARSLVSRVFMATDAPWRGLGVLPGTGLALRPEYSGLDALARFGIKPRPEGDEAPSGCLCPRVMTGQSEPEDCPHFGSACRPENPVGPCMVSDEGTCKIRLEFGGEA
jgi:hydrogenase expression/formation protein HypD